MKWYEDEGFELELLRCGGNDRIEPTGQTTMEMKYFIGPTTQVLARAIHYFPSPTIILCFHIS